MIDLFDLCHIRRRKREGELGSNADIFLFGRFLLSGRFEVVEEKSQKPHHLEEGEFVGLPEEV
jgi:hypothetical protein